MNRQELTESDSCVGQISSKLWKPSCRYTTILCH